jgi:hypothetical protein
MKLFGPITAQEAAQHFDVYLRKAAKKDKGLSLGR